MVVNLAEELYANSIQLKKYDSRKLLFSKNRIALEKELYQIQTQVNELELSNLWYRYQSDQADL